MSELLSPIELRVQIKTNLFTASRGTTALEARVTGALFSWYLHSAVPYTYQCFLCPEASTAVPISRALSGNDQSGSDRAGLFFFGAPDGIRTHTALSDQRFLRPFRLPVTTQELYLVAYKLCSS